MIGGNDVPRGPLRARGGNVILVRAHVGTPEGSLRKVGRRKLPVFFRILESLDQPIARLVLRNMEEKLEDEGSIAREMSLKGIDFGKAIAPKVIVYLNIRNALGCNEFWVHPND